MDKFAAPVIPIDDAHAHVDALIERARALLGFMDAEAAANVLIESGVMAGEAFLAVTAAKMLVS